ncbi:MAG TPA: OAM dimerization domain-containing protein [bacterium]|nr:OAM dimerization domain-containing protein [bacterium]
MSHAAEKGPVKKDNNRIKPYGDHWDDGKMQFSFTLPVPAGELAREAARLYLEKLGFVHPMVATMEPMGEGYTFFVAYAYATASIELSKIPLHKPEFPVVPYDQLVDLAHKQVRRKIVVVGATTGSDAHTVGIDAILSIKGIAGDKGLEYYPFFKVVNLRAQVDNRHLVDQAVEMKADAILVSKMVTQQDQHLEDLKVLSKMLREEKRLSPNLVRIAGGPRIDHRIAKSVGFDAGFGPGTKPSEVANFIVHELIRKISGAPAHAAPHRVDGEGHAPARPKRRSLFGWLGGRGKDS